MGSSNRFVLMYISVIHKALSNTFRFDFNQLGLQPLFTVAKLACKLFSFSETKKTPADLNCFLILQRKINIIERDLCVRDF